MKKSLVLVAIVLIGTSQLFAQKYMTRSGHIWFHSEAPLETIEAHNYQATSIIDSETGEVAFSLLIKGFQFEKALMQEHFNEKYLHSDKHPRSTYEGKITNISKVNLNKPGVHEVELEGNLTIHGVTKAVKTTATIENKDGKLYGKAKFPVAVKDYDISIPSMMARNIAEVVDVTVDVVYEPHNR